MLGAENVKVLHATTEASFKCDGSDISLVDSPSLYKNQFFSEFCDQYLKNVVDQHIINNKELLARLEKICERTNVMESTAPALAMFGLSNFLTSPQIAFKPPVESILFQVDVQVESKRCQTTCTCKGANQKSVSESSIDTKLKKIERLMIRENIMQKRLEEMKIMEEGAKQQVFGFQNFDENQRNINTRDPEINELLSRLNTAYDSVQNCEVCRELSVHGGLMESLKTISQMLRAMCSNDRNTSSVHEDISQVPSSEPIFSDCTKPKVSCVSESDIVSKSIIQDAPSTDENLNISSHVKFTEITENHTQTSKYNIFHKNVEEFIIKKAQELSEKNIACILDAFVAASPQSNNEENQNNLLKENRSTSTQISFQNLKTQNAKFACRCSSHKSKVSLERNLAASNKRRCVCEYHQQLYAEEMERFIQGQDQKLVEVDLPRSSSLSHTIKQSDIVIELPSHLNTDSTNQILTDPPKQHLNVGSTYSINGHINPKQSKEHKDLKTLVSQAADITNLHGEVAFANPGLSEKEKIFKTIPINENNSLNFASPVNQDLNVQFKNNLSLERIHSNDDHIKPRPSSEHKDLKSIVKYSIPIPEANEPEYKEKFDQSNENKRTTSRVSFSVDCQTCPSEPFQQPEQAQLPLMKTTEAKSCGCSTAPTTLIQEISLPYSIQNFSNIVSWPTLQNTKTQYPEVKDVRLVAREEASLSSTCVKSCDASLNEDGDNQDMFIEMITKVKFNK